MTPTININREFTDIENPTIAMLEAKYKSQKYILILQFLHKLIHSFLFFYC